MYQWIFFCLYKKSRIRETKHLSTNADSSTDAIGGWTKAKSAKKTQHFLARRFWTTSKQKCSNVRPLLSITFSQEFWIYKNIGHPTLGSGGKKIVKGYLKSEKMREKNFFFCAAILDNFQTKMFISETTSFNYFSPRIPNL